MVASGDIVDPPLLTALGSTGHHTSVVETAIATLPLIHSTQDQPYHLVHGEDLTV